MWEWIKSTIFKPVANFFPGIFANNQARAAENQPLLQKADVKTSSAPVLEALRIDQASNLSPFDTLPDEMVTEIGRYLPDQPPPSEKEFLSSTIKPEKKLSPLSNCIGSAQRFHSLFQPQRIVNKFLQYVVYGDQKKLEGILRDDPNLLPQLLLKKGQVTDYSGRTIDGTALQIALAAEDVKYHDDEKCMAEMLMRSFYMMKI